MVYNNIKVKTIMVSLNDKKKAQGENSKLTTDQGTETPLKFRGIIIPKRIDYPAQLPSEKMSRREGSRVLVGPGLNEDRCFTGGINVPNGEIDSSEVGY